MFEFGLKFARVFALALALAFFACSGGGGGGGGGDSSGSNSGGGEENSNFGTFKDTRDNKTYKTVKIGEQVWMAENLNYAAENSVCYYDMESYCGTYGRLYDWLTANFACPGGWHLPTNNDWNALLHYIDGTETEGLYDSPIAKHLKSTERWFQRSAAICQDTYGFNAQPAGFYIPETEQFLNVGFATFWWSADDYFENLAYYRNLSYNYEAIVWDHENKDYHFSVRCIKD